MIPMPFEARLVYVYVHSYHLIIEIMMIVVRCKLIRSHPCLILSLAVVSFVSFTSQLSLLLTNDLVTVNV